jgi:hypothetical protein
LEKVERSWLVRSWGSWKKLKEVGWLEVGEVGKS